MKDEIEKIIPVQKTGSHSNTESSVEFANEEKAKEFFQIASKRLFDVNQWHHLAGKATADFQLTDNSGHEIKRQIKKGDLFKIDIPGPGSISGEGFDWVMVETIESNKDFAAIRVRPVSSPLNDNEDIAHFFNDEATSSFTVKREKNKVVAGIYGRNENPNTNTETIVDKARNTAIATGAISGFSKLQWKSLVNGIVGL